MIGPVMIGLISAMPQRQRIWHRTYFVIMKFCTMLCISCITKKVTALIPYQDQGCDVVRSTGLEPVRSPTRPSNVRVCLFRHDRMTIFYYTHRR